uniref:Uncharacterized protein n=1 Tax=Arundo donax TaxID=35708 RepID=A0A0A9F868_ARUDO
MAPPLLPTKRT